MILLEELAPLIRNQRTIGLDTIIDLMPPGIPPFQLERMFVKGYRAHECLSTMPCKQHLRHRLCLDVLLDEPFQEILRDHMVLSMVIQLVLL